MKKPKIVFGKRPILMQRLCGGIRIIHVNGKVDWDASAAGEIQSMMYSSNFDCKPGDGTMYACTEGSTQREAYENCKKFDKKWAQKGFVNYSLFLGYL
jgi:hypothetical protein